MNELNDDDDDELRWDDMTSTASRAVERLGRTEDGINNEVECGIIDVGYVG